MILAVQNTELRSVAIEAPSLAVLPWSQIATPGATVPLVAADGTSLSTRRWSTPISRCPSTPASAGWTIGEASAVHPSLSLMPITSVGDVAVAARIGSALELLGCSTSVRSGRMVQVDDFKSDRPIILLGSAYANPWVALLNEHLNFHIEYDSASHKQVCKNRSPRPGETPVYVGTARTPMPGVGYATFLWFAISPAMASF